MKKLVVSCQSLVVSECSGIYLLNTVNDEISFVVMGRHMAYK